MKKFLYEGQKRELIELALIMGIHEIGIGDLSNYDHILTKRFPAAISLGVALSHVIGDLDVNDTRNEQRFHDLQLENRALIENVKLSLCRLLIQWGCQWYRSFYFFPSFLLSIDSPRTYKGEKTVIGTLKIRKNIIKIHKT